MDATTPAPGRMGEPDEPHGHTEAEPHHAVNYYAIFVALIVLTVLTVVVAFLGIRTEIVKVLLALTIAATKATFVARYFMHIKFEGKLIRLTLLCPLVLCVILIFALIPDIANGRHVSMNDMIHWFETGQPTPGTPTAESGPTSTGGQTSPAGQER